MKNHKSSIKYAAALVLSLGLLSVSGASFADWGRDCRVHVINGVRVTSCDRGYRNNGWNNHRRWENRQRWEHRRVCNTWRDRFGAVHHRCWMR